MMHRRSRRLRRFAIPTAIAMVPLAIMCAAVASVLLNPQSKPVAPEYSLTTAIEESGTTVGIADSNLWALSKPDGTIDTAAMDEHLAAMQALGANTVRVIIPWRGNEPYGPPGTLPSAVEEQFWARSDYLINAASERGMAVLGVLNHAPEWGGADPAPWATLGFEEAPDPELYADYAARVVARYGDKVGAYEIWNEPNALSGWAPTIDAAAYTEVLKAAWTAIKGPNGPDENDPMVVAGVLGAVVTVGGVTLDPRTFVDRMYDNGAKGFFDALSFHPYHYDLEFSQGEVTAQEPWKAHSPLEQVIKIRQLMLDNGDGALRIWATEYGLPTFGLNAVTEEQQRDFIEDFLNTWKDLQDEDGTPYAGPSFIYTLRDSLVNGELTEATSLGIFKFDILTGQWVAKLAADVIRDFIEANQTPDPPDQPGVPDLGAQLAKALQAFFHQIQVAFQGFVQSINAFVDNIAKAIAAVFNPGGAAALSLPPAVEDEVAEATTMAAMSWNAKNAEIASATKESNDEVTVSAEAVDSEAVDESVSAHEAIQTPEATETAAIETDASRAVEDADTTATDAMETDTSGTAADDDALEADAGGDSSVAATLTESREPVRTSLVARPGKIGYDDADNSADAATADDATNDADRSRGGSEAGGSDAGDADSGGSKAGDADSGGSDSGEAS